MNTRGGTLDAEGPALMTPAEVASALRVTVRTVTTWRTSGHIPQDMLVRTPGGMYRIRTAWLRAQLGGFAS